MTGEAPSGEFLKFGYRAMGVDDENGSFKLDVLSHGAVVGVGIRF